MMKSPLRFDLIDSKTGLLNKPNRPQYTPKPIGLGLLGSTISNATAPAPGHRNPDRQLEYQRNIQQQQMDQQANAGKVICREWYRQGKMEKRIFEADQAYGRYLMQYDPEVMLGYLDLAQPLVKLLQKRNKYINKVAGIFIDPWSKQMAYKLGVLPKGNIRGYLLMAIFTRVCRYWYRFNCFCARCNPLNFGL